jgi:hypothetical protein
MKIKKYTEFLNEADAPAPAPTSAPAVQPTAQPSAQPAQAQPSGITQTEQPQSTEEKSGDLSNYNNESATKFPDTVKKMVDMLKDMDKEGLIKVRNVIAEVKGMGDAKAEIGKL